MSVFSPRVDRTISTVLTAAAIAGVIVGVIWMDWLTVAINGASVCLLLLVWPGRGEWSRPPPW